MIALYWPAFVVAFVITVTEMTEVVALVFALSADHRTVAHGGAGAVVGIAVVALVALSLGALLLRLPAAALLWAAAIALAAFGVFLFRSTLRSYRAAQRGPTPATSPTRTRDAVQFAAGVSIGAIEATETVIVLLALTAAGYADTFPVAPNRNADGTVIPENQARNRRVVIKLEKIDKAANAIAD